MQQLLSLLLILLASISTPANPPSLPPQLKDCLVPFLYDSTNNHGSWSCALRRDDPIQLQYTRDKDTAGIQRAVNTVCQQVGLSKNHCRVLIRQTIQAAGTTGNSPSLTDNFKDNFKDNMHPAPLTISLAKNGHEWVPKPLEKCGINEIEDYNCMLPPNSPISYGSVQTNNTVYTQYKDDDNSVLYAEAAHSPFTCNPRNIWKYRGNACQHSSPPLVPTFNIYCRGGGVVCCFGWNCDKHIHSDPTLDYHGSSGRKADRPIDYSHGIEQARRSNQLQLHRASFWTLLD